MKFLYVTDLHGCKWKYDKIFKIAKELKIKAVINGGDMLPKSGDLFSQGKFITNYLDGYFSQFNSAGIFYLCYLGNDDLKIFDKSFEKTCNKYSFIVNLAQRKFEIEGFEFIGMNWVVDYPFRLKDRCRMDTNDYEFQKQYGSGILSTPDGFQELDNWFDYVKTIPTIETELRQLVTPKNMAQCIYMIHMPPSNLGLDECFGKIKVGSKAVYDFLHKHQPKLSLHGHIHESPEVSGNWRAKLNNTVCIQPGQMSNLTYVMIDLPNMKFERIIDK